ncbi:MAG: N-acetyltransferase [Bryobacteraceae bacterium]
MELRVEKASMADIPALLTLINANAALGIMLPRTEFEMAENLRDFSVIRADNGVVGCAALHFYTPTSAEVRSLAIDPAFQGRGAGKKLVEALEGEAQAFGLQSLFAFTYIPEFFRKLGFAEIERGALPLKAWKDCLRCPKFQCCDEIAVIKYFQSYDTGVVYTPICRHEPFDDSVSSEAIRLPIPRPPH